MFPFPVNLLTGIHIEPLLSVLTTVLTALFVEEFTSEVLDTQHIHLFIPHEK